MYLHLSEFKTQLVELMPLALPGNCVMMVTCTQCHHHGHQKEGNRNGARCEFESYVGFHYCGIEKLHPEFKATKCQVLYYDGPEGSQFSCDFLQFSL